MMQDLKWDSLEHY